jgi:hypothetical protein
MNSASSRTDAPGAGRQWRLTLAYARALILEQGR